MLLAAVWLFLGVLEDVISGDPLVQADSAVYHFLQGLRTVWADRIMIGVTELGDRIVTVALTVTILAWRAWRRAWHTAGYWLGAVGVAALLTTAIKLALHLPRPVTGLYSGWSAFSFPSGHVRVNASLYGFLAFLVARDSLPRRRVAIGVMAALWVVAIAFSRLYLGAHWLSDVMAGLSLATAWVVLLGIAYQHHRPPRLRPTAVMSMLH